MLTKIVLLFMVLLGASFAQGEPLCLSISEGLDRMCARDVAADLSCARVPKSLAWIADSCVIQQGDEVIPEVINLENGQAVAESIYEKYDASKIATSLIYRYFQKVERPKISEADVRRPSYPLYQQAESVLAFDSKYIDSIIENGFLNQFVTNNRPRKDGYMDRRVSTENFLSRLQLSQSYKLGNYPINHVRPKYAYGVFKSAQQAQVRNSINANYGGTFAVLKDSLKKRMTLTNMDSLAGHVLNDSGFSQVSLYFQSSRFSFPPSTGYYETQIWGEIRISDVSYFLSGCFGEKPDHKLLDALVQHKIDVPVYSCKLSFENGVYRLVPMDLLYGPELGHSK